MQAGKIALLRERIGDRTIVVALIACGIVLRVAWNTLRPTYGATGEALNVAMAFADGRGIADAYRPGSGPTAHFYPFSPGLGGLVYMLFGTRSALSETILACWSISTSLGTYLVVMSIFSRLGMRKGPRLLALAFACCAPVYLPQEAVDFRLWDGAVTALFMALLVDRLVALDAHPLTRHGPWAVGACCAALLVLNLPVGMAGLAATALLVVRRLNVRQTALILVTTTALLIVLVGPWVIRNYTVFHAFVPSRSNAGLELAIGMDPAALAAPDRMMQFMRRLETIHPTSPDGYRALLAAGGEVAYSKQLLHQTASWMAAHPADTARLMLLHLRQQFAPEPWEFAVFSQSAALSPLLRSVLATGVNLIGLAGVALALTQRRKGWIYLFVLVVGLSAITLPFQPMKRYTYLYYPFLVFAAADLIGRLWQAWRGRLPPTDTMPLR